MPETAIPFSSIAVDILLPPASLAWMAVLALLLPRRLRPRLVAGALLAVLVLLAMPVVGQSLLASLDGGLTDVQPVVWPIPDAIVILSADAVRTRGPGRLEVGPLTLERERAGAALQRATGLPVLVTGGLVNGPPPVGTLMEASMRDDFRVPVQWAEIRSGTTWENARFSAPILKEAGVKRVYLVTHAWHMRRSMLAFQRAGVEAVPAPVQLDPWPRGEWSELIPRMSVWTRSFYAIHEYVGLLYYAWRR